MTARTGARTREGARDRREAAGQSPIARESSARRQVYARADDGRPQPIGVSTGAGRSRGTDTSRSGSLRSMGAPGVASHKQLGIRPPLHPGRLRCSSLTYAQYSRSSRLAGRAHRRPRCVQLFVRRHTSCEIFRSNVGKCRATTAGSDASGPPRALCATAPGGPRAGRRMVRSLLQEAEHTRGGTICHCEPTSGRAWSS
jgi:hypothetical protein